jgi:nucleolar protein 58
VCAAPIDESAPSEPGAGFLSARINDSERYGARSMLVLVDTPLGYTLWQLTDESILSEGDLCARFPTAEAAASVVSLHGVQLFESTEQAVASLSALASSELDPVLSAFLSDSIVHAGIRDSLHVADAGLARAIEALGIACVAHGLATRTLKFSPSKVDAMIVHSVHLLEELDREVNNYGMRVREWYGWHFPELRLVTADNLLFAQLVLAMGRRGGALAARLEHLLSAQQLDDARRYAQRSVGTEISDDDLACIQGLAAQVVELVGFRNEIAEYVRQRMRAIAPNLTELVGETVGARLIAHAGSLTQLAKAAASTIQIFGAEKALFRALKEGKPTPKYGYIYHAHIVAHADQKLKGPLSRSLAAKAALSSRADAFGEEERVGAEDRERLEGRVRALEGQAVSFAVSRAVVKEPPQKIVVEQVPNYRVEEDFQLAEEQPKKKKRRKHRDAQAPE